LRLTKITLAAHDTPGMVAFYNAAFGCDLQPFSAYGATLYRGTIGGIPLVICPNEIAGTEGGQGKYQLCLAVADIAAVMRAGQVAGGSAAGDSALRDPDGNTIELESA
jgi:catechol 2,3-dioxygenase-like lactoylglutathione lyase family enzyme